MPPPPRKIKVKKGKEEEGKERKFWDQSSYQKPTFGSQDMVQC
jgi:hypothetical protein